MTRRLHRIYRWQRRFRRRHPIPWWIHVAIILAFAPAYMLYLSFAEVSVPDTASKLAIGCIQLLFFYIAIICLLPRAFRYKRKTWLSAIWVLVYLLVDLLVVISLLAAVSVATGAADIHWDEGGEWVVDIINLYAVMVPTFYFTGAISISYQVVAQALILYRHHANLKVLIEQKRATIQTLEMDWRRLQLDPHLLAGLLTRIRLMALKDPEQTWKVLNRVIAIMQYYCSIPPAQHAIPITEELAQVKNFLAMEALGKGDIHYKLDTTRLDGIRPVTIIPMLLIMLVKNQAKHGVINDKKYEALMAIATVGRHLHIQTQNYMKTVKDRSLTQGTRVGMKNIQSRLSHVHPERFSMRYGPDADGRYQVEIWIDLAS